MSKDVSEGLSGIEFLSGFTGTRKSRSNARAVWTLRTVSLCRAFPASRVYYADPRRKLCSGATMSYSRFEQVVIGAGALTVCGSVLISFASNGWPGWPILISQILLLPVLVVAIHYGRNAGLLAALLAATTFVLLQIPVLSAPAGLNPTEVASIAFSVAAFGLVGIVGGDLAGRVKYFFARHEQSSAIDDWSRVYNQVRASELLENARERFSRYGEPFAVVVIGRITFPSDMAPARQRSAVRAVANYLRSDVRMIDEVARLDDGRFLVILPHTQRHGGAVVTARLIEGMAGALGRNDEGVSASCYSASEDELEVGSLATNIARPTTGYIASSE
jgi:GGDEF domain-containing protein